MSHRSASGPAAPGQRFKTRIARRSSQDHETPAHHCITIEQSEPHFVVAASPRRVSSDWQTCQLLLLDSGERRLLACSVWQPAERRRCTTLTDRNAVGGKAAANYRLAACAPQNHAPRSCLFPPEPACELLQSKRAPRFPGEPLVSGGYNYVRTSSPPSWSGS